VLYGLNISQKTTPTSDIAEATYAANALGPALYNFEIGNEPDNFATFQPKWETFQAAGWAEQNSFYGHGQPGVSNVPAQNVAIGEHWKGTM
jgi:hypothetical protein